ncbi:MAG: hypothetical protein EAZ08_12855 [Cytophagales bacterium]|nr:MAG: hypothetical protein EAZ08_12855 [Cytophagales bacterium]
MNDLFFSFTNVLRFLFGISSAALGLFFIASGTMVMLKEELSTGLLISLLFGVFPLSIGSWFLFWTFKEAQNNREKSLAKKVIGIAIAQGGKVTPVEVALLSDCAIDEAKKELDLLYGQGLFDLQLSQEGITVYHYKEMLSTESKNNAQDIITNV